jgi:hypothetical protein
MRYLLLCFTLLLLAGCMPAHAATIDSISTSQWLPAQIPASGLLYLPLDPAGAPEDNPILVVEGTIIDAATHQPVTADVYIVNAREYRTPTPAERVLHSTEHFEIQLLSHLDGWFVVRAPGYEDWTLRLHYRLKTSRKLSGPVQLRRLSVGKMTI